MKIQLNTLSLTLLLSTTAGFCDTSTFAAADQIFSAHVTGNFIVFAYEVIKGSDTNSWLRLGTFPVFVISIFIGKWITERFSNKYTLVIAEGIILIMGGLGACYLTLFNVPNQQEAIYFIVMMVVFAMGLQNAFGRIFSKEVYGPTTVMTGNVTQAALDIYNIITGKLRDSSAASSFKKQVVVIGGFLTGCLAGAVLVNYVGLSAVALPGILLVISFGLRPKE